MFNKHKKLFYRVNLALLLFTVILNSHSNLLFGLNLSLGEAEASESIISTRADFNEGEFKGTESYSKEGELRIESDGQWGAQAWRTNDVQPNNGTSIESDGTYTYLLTTRENTFQRYLPDEDEWEDLAPAPHSAYIGSALTYMDGYVYAIFGGYQKEFSRYNVRTDTWEELADAPELIYSGGTLSNNGTYIYALRGGSTSDFWRYNPQTNSWSSLSSTPAIIGSGASLVYDGDNYLFTARGASNAFIRYDIEANSWSAMTNIPATSSDMGKATLVGDYIYFVQGSSTTFRRYSISGNSWSTAAAAPAASRYVGVVYNEYEDLIYVFQGNGSYNWWKYDIDTDSFIGSTDLPAVSTTGGDLVYYGGLVYYKRGGNQNSFYSYSPITNAWTTLTNAPATLANTDTKGSTASGNLYFYRGNDTNFYRYNVSGGTWTTLSTTPSSISNGGVLAYPGSGNYIYGTRGAGTLTFMRYDILADSWNDGVVADLPTGNSANIGFRMVADSQNIYAVGASGNSNLLKYDIGTNTWSIIGQVPFSPYYGTDLRYYGGKIYAISGYYKTDFWEYTISSNTWRRLPRMEGYYAQDIGPYNGASIAGGEGGVFYINTGSSLSRMMRFNASNYNYPVSATWTSKIIDLTYVGEWDSFDVSKSTPADSSITFETRTSTDQSSWSSWQSVSGDVISSPERRYIQIRATLYSTTDRTQTPSLSSITINYTGDESPPSNPSTTTGSSQAVGGVTLNSGDSYPYLNPYFNWPNPGQSGGASDTESNIKGYYVYFGSNNSADPQSAGSFQSTTNYTVASPLTTGTYYLRIKTQDEANNVSAAQTLFTYTYNGVSPPNYETQSETSQFDNGEAENVSTENDKIKLSALENGFWMQERLSLSLGAMSNGSQLAHVASTGMMYSFRGGNMTTFYGYNTATDSWTTLAAAPATVNAGGSLVEGPSGYLYGLRGNTSQTFWRYNIAGDSWTTVSSIPNNVSSGGKLIYDGSQYIYAFSGNNDDAFFRYNTSADNWEALANADFGATANQLNNNVTSGADLAIDEVRGKIYAIQGGLKTGFSSYDTDSNTWSVMPNLPMIANHGAQIVYDSERDTIYYVPGYGRPYLFQYDFSTEEWIQLPNAPAPLGTTSAEGTSLRIVGDYMYVLRGGGSTTMYKYDLDRNSWQVPQFGLFQGEFRGTDYKPYGAGAVIVKGDNNNYYLLRGLLDNLFVRYNATTGESTLMSDAPMGFTTGSALAYDSVNNKIYAIPGATAQKLFVYDVETDTWSEDADDSPPAAPGGGSTLTYDGARYIYWTRGGNTNGFYRYDTQAATGSRWATMSSTGLGTLNTGSSMVYENGYIYLTRGNNTLTFYRYDVNANSWNDIVAADLPTGGNFTTDAFLVKIGTDSIYGCRGGNDFDCFVYSISDNTWTPIANAPANFSTGAAAASDRESRIFVIPGTGGTNTFNNGLYSYVAKTDDTSFVEEGTYTTEVIDLNGIYKFGNLSIDYTSGPNTSLSVETRVSEDGNTWDNWTPAINQKIIGDTYNYTINSDEERYIQLRFTLTSGDGIYSGTINDYSISYYSDSTAPENPTSITGYTSATHSATLTNNNWYQHTAPNFDWPDAESEGGATDSTSGSRVTGYYVYFGTDINADPEEDGVLQSGTAYTASSLTSGSTYYLKIKTTDDAGNISDSTWDAFIYKFDNTAPENPTIVTANPSGYTAINDFDFSWSGATDSASGVVSYCYKTTLTGAETCNITGTSVEGVVAGGTGASTFYVRAQDEAGNRASTYSTVSYYYSSTAPSAPRNLEVSPQSSKVNQFSFEWDPPTLFFGSQANLRYYYSVNALPTAQNVNAIGLTVTNLAEDAYATVPGDNIMYVVAKDEAGNIDYNSYAQVTFNADTSAPGVPLKPDIADISVKALEAWKLAITWEAPVSTGSGVASYKIYGSTTPGASCSENFDDFTYLASTTGRSYVDTELDQVNYYYCVKSCDSTNNCSAASSTVTMLPTGKFEFPADLTASPSATVNTKSATIEWATSRTSNSFVRYGTESGKYGTEVGSSNQVTAHEILIENLAPGTKYYYQVLWTDEDGNEGVSEEMNFTTEPAPVVSSVKMSNISINSALINFSVQYATTVRILYGLTSSYGGIETLSTSKELSSYTVELDELEEGVEYHVQIVAEDAEGNIFSGDDYTFETLPQPKVTAFRMQQVAGQATATLRLLWTSNTPITSVVTYYPTSNPSAARDNINLVLRRNHSVIISDLLDETDYTVIVKGNDSAGNEAVYTPQSVKTAADLREPEIENMNVESTIIGVGDEARAQLVISWDTDEPATSQVEYAEGTGTTYSQSSQEDTNLQENHSVTISGLNPASIYHLRAVSKDKSNNIGNSFDTVVVTPKSTKDALTLVIENLSNTFGFLKGISN